VASASITEYLTFATPRDWALWLAQNHDIATEANVRMFKKGSGLPSLTWEDAVIESLAWGWIDGVKRSLDAQSWVQRFTPRRARSGWSQRNRDHAERLIAAGRMMPPGLAQVAAAKADGRWDAAYAGKDFEVPPDFLLAMAGASTDARAHFSGLNRKNHFALYYRLTTAKRAETRAKRVAEFVAMMERGERFY
jgi:uncharacterized protein YdeI (YjbR/CyaY-like superfamily)